MGDYSDAPEWATEVFYQKSNVGTYYYSNDKQYCLMGFDGYIGRIHLHSPFTLSLISGGDWSREPLNFIVENE